MGQHGGGTAAHKALIGNNFNKILAQRLVGWLSGVGVLDAQQVGDLYQLQARPRPFVRRFKDVEPNSSDFHNHLLPKDHRTRIEAGFVSMNPF
jgi:hypothetical protein